MRTQEPKNANSTFGNDVTLNPHKRDEGLDIPHKRNAKTLVSFCFIQ